MLTGIMVSDSEQASEGGNPTLEVAMRHFASAGSKSPNYQANCGYVISQFIGFLNDRGVDQMEDMTATHVSRYAQYLSRRHDAYDTTSDDSNGISKSTLWTYFGIVSAFLSYAKEWGWIEANHAERKLVRTELPPKPTPESGEQQFWSSDQREQLLSFVDERARDAIDEKGLDATIELRDRALVYLLAYTGVRSGEILNDPRDDRRDGLQWKDVGIEEGVISILGKNQQQESAILPRQTYSVLDRLRQSLPLSGSDLDEWPVIFSDHVPSIYSCLPDGFSPESDDDTTLFEYCADYGVAPPALTTNGGRNLMKRLCDKSNIAIESGYLKPHGARRGVGEFLYRTEGSAAAQRALRHADPETTSKMYSHIESSELSDEVGDAFENE